MPLDILFQVRTTQSCSAPTLLHTLSSCTLLTVCICHIRNVLQGKNALLILHGVMPPRNPPQSSTLNFLDHACSTASHIGANHIPWVCAAGRVVLQLGPAGFAGFCIIMVLTISIVVQSIANGLPALNSGDFLAVGFTDLGSCTPSFVSQSRACAVFLPLEAGHESPGLGDM